MVGFEFLRVNTEIYDPGHPAESESREIIAIKGDGKKERSPVVRKMRSSQKVTISTMLLLFSALLIYFDNSGAFIEGIPRETIVVVELIFLSLIPLYLKRIRAGYIIGMLVAGFVAFSYRGDFFGPAIPIFQYFLGFFSILALIETTKMLQSCRAPRR